MFIEDRCDLCGECLVRCPELTLSKEQAKAEMDRLIKAEEPQWVLTKCASCLSCNTYCPQACNPYDLILSRWNGRYHRLGSPPAWRFVFPTQESNLWSSMHALFPEQSRRTVEAWMKARPSETVFLPGSYFHLVPEVLSGSRLLRDQTVMSLPGHWECGAYLYQGGYLDVVRRIGRMVRDDLNRWGVRKVITALDAVYILFTKVHPEENGIVFEQEFVNFHEWILEGIESGEFRVENPLHRTVTVHDNCYAKVGGKDYFGLARRLLDLAGVRVVEMDHHHADALCCGFGRGAGWSRNTRIPFDILQGTTKRIHEAEATGADTLVTYCAGCFWLLLAANELLGSPVRVVHMIELVREAMGERVEFPREDRGWDVLAAMTFHMVKAVAADFLWIEEVKADMDPAEWKSGRQLALRTFRSALNHRAGRRAFKSAFRAMQRLVS